MKNNNFSLNNGVVKKHLFFAEIFLLSHCKLKTIQVIIKSPVHAVATFNSNMSHHITFQINRIVNMRVLYNGNFKNMTSRKMRLKFDNMFKAT